MKKYSSYKQSGVEWIGEIPTDWNTCRLKFCFNSISGGVWGEEPSGDENDIICIRVADFQYKQGIVNPTNLTIRNISLSEQNNRLLKKGDLLIEKSGGGELSPVGRVVIFDLDAKAVCSNFITRLNTKTNYSPDFLNYLNRFLYYKGITESCINQTTGIQNLKVGEFVSNTIFIPSLPEQYSIVSYLDHKTDQIDRFIANRQKQIVLLKEQKAAIINKAVTKGINPTANMKPSGIEWIGDIPEGWLIIKLKFCIKSMVGGGTPSKENPEYWNGDIPWVSPKDMKSDYIEKSEDYITITGLEESSTNLIEEPSVLIVVRSGILKHTFPIAINKVHVALNQDLKALIPNKRFSIEYLFVLLRGVANIVLFSCSKIAATVDSIETDDLLKFLLPVPSLEEQKKIITYIETETSTIEALITKYQRQIDLMQEYRTSLISQAVTGKFDVRDWQPKTRKPSAEQWPMAITSKN